MPDRLDAHSWAVTAFAEAALGDARRTQRLVKLATVLAQRPGAARPEACGTRAMLNAAYRFFDNAAMAPQELLASHGVATSARLAAVPLVLAVQATTELAWTTHPATRGLGPLAHPAHRGLQVHTTRALPPERRPLGLLAQRVWGRASEERGKHATRKRRPLAEQASSKGRRRVEAGACAPAPCPPTPLVCIGDRAADVSDLFVQERPSGVDLLVRAAWNRRVDHPERYRWAKVAAHPVAATLSVRVPRRGAPPARQATGRARWCLALRCPPTHRQAEQRPTVAVWGIQAAEAQPPAGRTAIAWLLGPTWGVPTPPPAQPPPLRAAGHWIGRLGGFLARRGDAEPGGTVWWNGLRHLTDLTFMSRIMRPPPPKRQPVGKA